MLSTHITFSKNIPNSFLIKSDKSTDKNDIKNAIQAILYDL